MLIIRSLCALIVISASVLLQSEAKAQYPTHSITAIVPFAAGSSNDTVARIIVPPLSAALGQSIVILNKPGGDALIGIGYVANSKPDGYTMLFSAGAVVQAPALHRSISYDPAHQIMGVASFGINPYVIVANTKLGVNTLSELLAYLKANPGKLNVPTSGNSSTITANLFKQATGADFSLINYSGTGPAATSLLSGETDFAILDGSSFHSLDPSREKVLAVAADERMAAFPGIPTVAEAGLPGFTATASFGLFMPGGTPTEIADRINAEINKVIAIPKVVEQLQGQGIITKTMGRAEYDAKYQSDLIMWKDVVTKAKIPLSD